MAYPNTIIFCGDNHEKAIDRTENNLESLPEITNVNHFAWDAQHLPIKEGVIDIIVTDLVITYNYLSPPLHTYSFKILF